MTITRVVAVIEVEGRIDEEEAIDMILSSAHDEMQVTVSYEEDSYWKIEP